MPNLPDNMILQQMELGPMNNFLYFIGDAYTKEIAVVDPAWEVDYLCQQASKFGYTITSIFLTHGHPDHVNGLEEILKVHDVPAYISRHEAPYYKPKHKNLIEIDDHHKLPVGNLVFDTIWTPGHTPGGQCFHYKNVLVTGDTLFIDGCGRCDLPGGDPLAMYTSLSERIMKLPDETLLYTGHNYGPKPVDTLGAQKKTNPYLTCSSKSEFLQNRMGISF